MKKTLLYNPAHHRRNGPYTLWFLTSIAPLPANRLLKLTSPNTAPLLCNVQLTVGFGLPVKGFILVKIQPRAKGAYSVPLTTSGTAIRRVFECSNGAKMIAFPLPP